MVSSPYGRPPSMPQLNQHLHNSPLPVATQQSVGPSTVGDINLNTVKKPMPQPPTPQNSLVSKHEQRLTHEQVSF